MVVVTHRMLLDQCGLCKHHCIRFLCVMLSILLAVVLRLQIQNIKRRYSTTPLHPLRNCGIYSSPITARSAARTTATFCRIYDYWIDNNGLNVLHLFLLSKLIDTLIYHGFTFV